MFIGYWSKTNKNEPTKKCWMKISLKILLVDGFTSTWVFFSIFCGDLQQGPIKYVWWYDVGDIFVNYCDLMWSISSNTGQICWLIKESSWILLGTRWAAPKIPIGGFYASCTIYITYLYLGIIMTHYRKPLWTSWYTSKAITKVALAIFSDYVPEPTGFIVFIDGNQ